MGTCPAITYAIQLDDGITLIMEIDRRQSGPATQDSLPLTDSEWVYVMRAPGRIVHIRSARCPKNAGGWVAVARAVGAIYSCPPEPEPPATYRNKAGKQLALPEGDV